MKDTLHQLGLKINELAILLLVPERTVRTWFNRKTSIPSKYSGYIIEFDQ